MGKLTQVPFEDRLPNTQNEQMTRPDGADPTAFRRNAQRRAKGPARREIRGTGQPGTVPVAGGHHAEIDFFLVREVSRRLRPPGFFCKNIPICILFFISFL